tara:strand:- start:578 stop:976 length:399 start_codon:yes stop_codon:yes gene_type:complete
MDLKDFTPKSDVVEVTVMHPVNGEPLTNKDGSEMTIVLHAPHSKPYKEIMYEQTNKRLKAAQGTGSMDLTAQDLEESSLDLLSKATKSWNITYDEKQPKLTVAKAKAIYDELFWLKPQLEGAINNAEVFMKA